MTDIRQTVTDFRLSVTNIRQTVADFPQSMTVFRQSVTDIRLSVTDIRRSVTDFRLSVTEIRRSVTDFRRSVTDIRRSVTDIRRSEVKFLVFGTGQRMKTRHFATRHGECGVREEKLNAKAQSGHDTKPDSLRQRRCVNQPRVGAQRLPWKNVAKLFPP